MSVGAEVEPGWRPPTRLSATVFALKASAHRLRRALLELRSRPPRHAAKAANLPTLIAEVRSPLLSDGRREERVFQLGKIDNLKRAARDLDGVVMPAGEVLSFWRQVGAPTLARGFVEGRMLQEGCLVPSVGGGLCQLTNALYQAAEQSGCEIVERHAHSRVVPGSEAETGRDATVAWNYLDLRFKPNHAVRIEVAFDDDELAVRFYGPAGATPAKAVERLAAPPAPPAPPAPKVARTCATCNEASCFRKERA